MEEAETNGEWRRSLEMVERRADGYRDGDGNAWAVFWDPNLGLLLGLGLADDLGRGSDEGEGDGGIEGALTESVTVQVVSQLSVPPAAPLYRCTMCLFSCSVYFPTGSCRLWP